MPEVITDTSPIQYLYQINQLNLLPTLYRQVRMQYFLVKIRSPQPPLIRGAKNGLVSPFLRGIKGDLQRLCTLTEKYWVRMPQAVADELAQGRSQGISLPDLTSLSQPV